MKLPILLKQDETAPQHRYCLLFAENGWFLAKDTLSFRAHVQIDLAQAFRLLPHQEFAELKIKLPLGLVCQALDFFRHVFVKFRTEAYLAVYLSAETGELSLFCPKQQNFSAHVHVEIDPDAPDALKVADIHSHPDAAFHSTGDQVSERQGDGLHIVVGKLGEPTPEFVATLVVQGRRFPLDPEQVMELPRPLDPDWAQKIHPEGKLARVRSWIRRRP